MLAMKANALGPGCDHDEFNYRLHSIHQLTLPDELVEAAEAGDQEAIWQRDILLSRDITIHVPVCLTNLDPEISMVQVICTPEWQDFHRAAWRWYSDAVNWIETYDRNRPSADVYIFSQRDFGDFIGTPVSEPFTIDRVVQIHVDAEHRGEVGRFARFSCEVRVGHSSGVNDRPLLGPQNNPEDYPRDFYRLAAPDSEFLNPIEDIVPHSTATIEFGDRQ
jgi:hypothetical protein